MLDAMRQLGMDYLYLKLEQGAMPENLEDWYRQLVANRAGELFPFLVESLETMTRVFVISPDKEPDTAKVTAHDATPELLKNTPFMKPSGSQSPQVGPVLKRSIQGQKAGPSNKILNSTMREFEARSQAGQPWSAYFDEICKVLARPRVLLAGDTLDWAALGHETMLECLVQRIPETKGTCIIACTDGSGKLPGQRQDYINYLMNEKIAKDRYVTGGVVVEENKDCPLCGALGVPIFPNAVKGAGLNILNLDRQGAFPGLNLLRAWQRFGLCSSCANLLYVYKYHVLAKGGPEQKRRRFVTSIAGENALVVPLVLSHDTQSRKNILNETIRWADGGQDEVQEEDLLETLKDERGLLNLTFLWVSLGQNLEGIKGMLTDVPPSRLGELSDFNNASKVWTHPVFPGTFLNEFLPDLALSALKPILNRPGGRAAKNDSNRLFHARRLIAAAVYHKRPIEEASLWREIMEAGRWYWLAALEKNKPGNDFVFEGTSKKGPYLTAAGWVRHIAWWIYYFKKMGVLPMENEIFTPEMEELRPFFGPETGIDSPQKAFAFLVGVLYGKLLMVQAGRSVNVGANALTWLKRLTLKGRDLPELFVKIREKSLSYEMEKSPAVRNLIAEIGRLGCRLGDNIELAQVPTNYFLMLGQSMTNTILPRKGENGQKEENND